MMFFAPPSPRRADAPALVARLAAGDAAALEPLYRSEAGPVYRYLLALGGNPAWAADATQDAFIALASRPAGFDPQRGSLGAYLAGIARHRLLAVLRAEQPQEPIDDPDALPLGAAESPEALLVRLQDQASLWAAIRALPLPMREALVLVDLQERAYADAAQIAGIPINTLRTRLHRARLQLAALLNAAAGEPR